jgi:hypothetical protein
MQNQGQFFQQVEQQKAQVEITREQISTAPATDFNQLQVSEEQLGADELRSQLLAQLEASERDSINQLEAQKVALRKTLIKQSVKWGLGCLIVGFLLFGLSNIQ